MKFFNTLFMGFPLFTFIIGIVVVCILAFMSISFIFNMIFDRLYKKPNKVKVISIYKKIYKILMGLMIIGGVSGLGIIFYASYTAPNLDADTFLATTKPSTILDDKGDQIDKLGNLYKVDVAFDDVSKYVVDAFIATEDYTFYSHDGLNFKRILSSFIKNVVAYTNGSDIQGASTITQQTVKYKFFLEESIKNRVDYTRKIKEMYLALELEKKVDKKHILESYINSIFFGGNATGINNASKQYFDKSPKDLNLVESAFIAGMAQSPSRNYPFSEKNKQDPSLYINRTKVVLGQMLKYEKINQQQYDDAIKDIDTNKIAFNSNKEELEEKYVYDSFMQPMIAQIKEDLIKKYNYTEQQAKKLIYSGGLTIKSTMNERMQNYSQKVLDSNSSFPGLTEQKDSNGILQPQASSVSIDNKTGQVKAVVGGRGEQPPGSYNRAAASNFLNPIGSTIKPLTVYAPAIESKLITAASILDDSKLSDELIKKYGYESQPQNADNKYLGNVSVRSALSMSRNLPVIKLLDKLTLDTSFEYANKFGLNLKSNDKTVSSLGLGQQHEGLTTLQVAAAYTVFANEGKYVKPMFYTEVLDSTGKVILTPEKQATQVISKETSYIIYDLLKSVVQSGAMGSNANLGSMPSAGKTGTTTDFIDYWFAGLTPNYTCAIWLGSDNNEQVKIRNSNSMAYAWKLIMEDANDDLPNTDIQKPDNVLRVDICSETGELATSTCKSKGTSHSELFIKGTQPVVKCTKHKSIFDSDNNNKQTPSSNPIKDFFNKIFGR